MKFSRQEYWSRLPFPTVGDLPDPEIKPISSASPPLAGRFFTMNTTWEALSANSTDAFFNLLEHPPHLTILWWVEWWPPKYVHLKPGNVTLYGKRVFEM